MLNRILSGNGRASPDVPPGNDRYGRESFTFRRMRPWQIWIISIAIIVLVTVAVLLAIGYGGTPAR